MRLMGLRPEGAGARAAQELIGFPVVGALEGALVGALVGVLVGARVGDDVG